MLKTAPAVFAVGNEYQIMVTTTKPALLSVLIENEEYFDESNGIMRSLSDLHRVSVPMDALDRAGEYILRLRPIIERKPYFTETEALVEIPFAFYPVPKENIRAYHIADAHNRISEPVAAAKAFGEIDFLILNGDVINHSGDPSKFDNIYEICARLTGGSKPVVFSRGNHDMRGNYAERFADYTPNAQGRTYYSFRLGSIWGVLLDCGEDKADDHAEYGYTVCCHAFRQRQTVFLHRLIAEKEKEYAADGITHRLVISHVPFAHRMAEPFDIEEAIYTEWSKLLREEVHPNVMICGHVHRLGVWEMGGSHDNYGQPCPVVVGSKPGKEYWAGCGYIFGREKTQVIFTDSTGAVLGEEII
ncbi:MAG: metallophosphoesterase [Clostridia bacterium]|nr:metallophosphoesterase [Clostridia bacterium]